MEKGFYAVENIRCGYIKAKFATLIEADKFARTINKPFNSNGGNDVYAVRRYYFS